jgi:hypothetical protein
LKDTGFDCGEQIFVDLAILWQAAVLRGGPGLLSYFGRGGTPCRWIGMEILFALHLRSTPESTWLTIDNV